MAKESSFDIVSKLDMQSLKDALNTSEKTIKSRYDLKEGTNSIELNEKDSIVIFTASSELSLKSLKEIFIQNCIKKNISTKSFDFGQNEKAFSGHIRLQAKLKQGIDKESARIINNFIKEKAFKVKTLIQDEQIRVTGKDIDTLQEVIQALREYDKLEIALQFLNYR